MERRECKESWYLWYVDERGPRSRWNWHVWAGFGEHGNNVAAFKCIFKKYFSTSHFLMARRS